MSIDHNGSSRVPARGRNTGSYNQVLSEAVYLLYFSNSLYSEFKAKYINLTMEGVELIVNICSMVSNWA